MCKASRYSLGLVVAVFLGMAGDLLAQPETRGQLIRCADTSFSSGIYASYYTGSACGGDPLTLGDSRILPVPHLRIRVEGANALNMYEVYWLSIGGDPTSSTDAVLVGNFLTDTNGDASTLVRVISAPADAATATPVLLPAVLGTNQEAGCFLIFSRGPYAYDTDGDGVIDSYNTSDNTAAGTVHNPVVTLSNGGVQFISGFARP